MDLSTVLKLLAKNGKDLESMIATIGVGNLLSMLPNILAIIKTISESAHDAQQQGMGKEAAYAAAAHSTLQAVQMAREAEIQAAQAAAEHPDDDDGFLPGGMRHS